jgi:diguanylate cyclase (GGDEF)-like protein/PAS domain S-box-containing protein
MRLTLPAGRSRGRTEHLAPLRGLPDPAWVRRHGLVVAVLLAHVVGALALAATDPDPLWGLLVAGILGAAAAAAALPQLERKQRTLAAAAGLIAATLAVGPLTDGAVPSVFHLFAVVALISLYEELAPQALVLLVVAAHAVSSQAFEVQILTGEPASVGGLLGVLAGVLVASAAALAGATWRRAEEDLTERVLDSTTEGIVGIDERGRILFANGAAGRHLGTDANSLVGQDHHAAIGHLDRDGKIYDVLRCPVCRILRSAESLPVVDQQFRRVNGRPVSVEYLSTKLALPEGETGLLMTFRDVSDDARLARSGMHDPLTALPNRYRFADHLERALVRLGRLHCYVAVLYVDIDRFKLVNSSISHDAGDGVLVEAARRLEHVVRAQDTVARVGGDEFAVLCVDIVDEEDACRVARRILDAFLMPIKVDVHDIPVSVSVGLVVTNVADADQDRLLHDADAAMVRAKGNGGARFEVFDTAMRDRVGNRLRLETQLRHALEVGDLRVHYQPKVSLHTGHITGVEALVRWWRPEEGLVPPNEFIPVAEQSGLIVPIGEFVLEQACLDAKRWRETLPNARSLIMAVNLSARQLAEPNLVEYVGQLLERTGLPPAALCLEITESVVMNDVEESIRLLHGLKELGVKLAVDDFGTGYSSLAYLSRFPVDILKIDRSFVKGLASGGDSRPIVESVVSLASALRMITVAEGVEDEDQAGILRQLGCTLAQGFLFARPMGGEEAERLIRRGLSWTPHPDAEPITGLAPLNAVTDVWTEAWG